MAGVDRILDVRAAAGDQDWRRLRVVGGDDAALVRAVLAGLNDNPAPVLGEAQADGEGDILGLLVERPVIGGRVTEHVQAGAVGAPIVVHLGEDEAAAVGCPDDSADADLGHRLDVAAGGKVADAELEPLRAIVVDQGGGVAAVRADLQPAEPEILLALRLGGFVENRLRMAAGHDGDAIPGPVLRARRERPPVIIVPVALRDGAVILGHAPAHLGEERVGERAMGRHGGFEIGVLGAQVGQHVGVVDRRVGAVAQPVIRVLDGHAVALEGIRPLLGDGGRRKAGLGGHGLVPGLGGGGGAREEQGGDQQAHEGGILSGAGLAQGSERAYLAVDHRIGKAFLCPPMKTASTRCARN